MHLPYLGFVNKRCQSNLRIDVRNIASRNRENANGPRVDLDVVLCGRDNGPEPMSNNRILGILGTAVIAAAASAPLSACSFLVDPSKAQCSSDDDCRSRGALFAGAFCSTDNVCVRSVDYCSSNSECIDRTGNDATICRKTDNTCVGLLTKNCKLLADKDDLRDDNALVFGSHGIPSWAAAVQACEFGMELVRRDFKGTQGGLPPTPKTNGKARPVVFLSCDIPIGQQEQHKVVTDHLIDAVRVPMMLGPFATIDMTTYGVQKLPQGETAMFTVSEDQPAFDILGRRGKFFSFGLPRGAVVNGQAGAVALIEPLIRAAENAADLKVAYVYPGGVSDNDARLFSEQARYNGKLALEQPLLYKEFGYGSISSPTFGETASNVAIQVKAFSPNIVIYRGSDEVTVLAGLVERQLPGQAYHVFPIEGRNGTPGLVGTNEGLRKRVVGFRPGRYEQDARVQRLNARYSAAFGAEAPPSPLMRACVDMAYHALYAAGAVPGETVTGSALGAALATRFRADGVQVDATPSSILKAFSTLQSGQNLYVVGTEADGLWDPMTGVNDDWSIEYWCVNPAPAVGGDPLMDTGVYYSSRTKAVTGTSSLLGACLK